MTLCQLCLHELREGRCVNRYCPRSGVETGYTVPPATLSAAPDPFPAEVCLSCGQTIPKKPPAG